MQDPNGLFRLETDSDPLEAAAPVLIVALAGFFDAGSAQGLLVRHLMERYDHQVVATFDIDATFERFVALLVAGLHRWGDRAVEPAPAPTRSTSRRARLR